MGSLRVFALLAALFAVVGLTGLTACTNSNGGSGETALASAGGATVVAEVNGAAITAAELEEAAESALARIRQEEYDIRRQALEDLIADRLLAEEAKKRGLSSEDLLRQEVEARTRKPSRANVEAVYERNRQRFAGEPRAETLARIEEALLGRSAAEGEVAYERDLRARADVTVHLDPPRLAIDIPQGAPGMGPDDAPVTIVEFTDYQCPYCHRAQDVLDKVLEEYPGKVRLVHLDFPLDNHTGAIPAARAARCAGEQGRFWEYHRSLMSQPGTLDDADLTGRATSLELDTGDFATCLASDRHDAAIQAELEQGADLGVTGTPAYFINGRLISGARPFPHFAEVIDDELAGG